MKRALPPPRFQAGFVLPTAIFLLVVLAALGTYLATLARTSHMSSALDVQGVRALQAARAGIEWAIWQVATPAVTPPCPASPAPLTLAGTLSAFSVTVECVRTVESDGADTVALYQITSTATTGAAGEVDYVERRLQATLAR